MEATKEYPYATCGLKKKHKYICANDVKLQGLDIPVIAPRKYEKLAGEGDVDYVSVVFFADLIFPKLKLKFNRVTEGEKSSKNEKENRTFSLKLEKLTYHLKFDLENSLKVCYFGLNPRTKPRTIKSTTMTTTFQRMSLAFELLKKNELTVKAALEKAMSDLFDKTAENLACRHTHVHLKGDWTRFETPEFTEYCGLHQ
jgi:hypothetical protein